jgi:16S rRNA (adenine1518-N6/adenine1519-N6)-dimethyltransferase
MKGNDIRDRLRELGRKPNKRYGQHFLVDQSVLNTIISSAEINAGDRVLEIGPGLGILTETLIDAGASVIAIEKDKALARELQVRLGDRAKIVEGDAVEGKWEVGSGEWKLVANIPYSITSQVIKKALWSTEVPSMVVLLVQREVAERIVSGMGHGASGVKKKPTPNSPLPTPQSLLSLTVSLASHSSKIIRKVPRKCFYPAPDVESSLLKIVPMTHEERLATWGVDPSKILSLASRAFASQRKKMTTTLASTGMPKERIVEGLIAAGASPDARPEELGVEQWGRFVQSTGHGARSTG